MDNTTPLHCSVSGRCSNVGRVPPAPGKYDSPINVDPEDVLASVANYFRRHGWRQHEPVTFAVTPNSTDYRALLRKELKPKVTLEQLRSHGLVGGQESPAGPFTVMELKGANGPEVWVGHYNFYVITRYNHSRLYAMAVHQLSRAVRERRTQP